MAGTRVIKFMKKHQELIKKQLYMELLMEAWHDEMGWYWTHELILMLQAVDKNTIDSIVNKLNYQLNNSFYVSLNEFYDEIGLEENEMGSQLGWNNNSGLIEIDYSSQLSPRKEPCLVISFRYGPVYDYQSLY